MTADMALMGWMALSWFRSCQGLLSEEFQERFKARLLNLVVENHSWKLCATQSETHARRIIGPAWKQFPRFDLPPLDAETT